MRLKKRNNYTLSADAQTIIDTVKNKSRFVSEAIVSRGDIEHNIKTIAKMYNVPEEMLLAKDNSVTFLNKKSPD